MRKYLVEFVGTFFLVFTIGMTVLNPGSAGPLAPLAIGSVLMVMIYAGGHISGGHYNPAVTLGVFLRGKCPIIDVPFYWIAQCAGAVFAGVLVPLIKGAPDVKPLEILKWQALIAEALFTFALVWVVLNVATSKDTAGNSNYGLAIGFTVTAGAFAVGSVSGGAFNPAVAVGLGTLRIAPWNTLWIYLAGEAVGAVIAAALFRVTNPDDN